MNNDNMQDPSQQALAQRLALWAGVLRDCSASRVWHGDSRAFFDK